MDYLRIRDHLTQAESCFRQGLAADPDHPECLLYLAVTLRNLGRFKEADRLLRHALEISPMDPVVHMQVGTLRRWQKRLHESLQAYDAALLIDPTHVNTRVARAITLQEMNRWEQALKGYDQLISELTTEEVEGNALPRRRREVAEILARIASNGLDMKLEPQALAVALYHKANQLVLEGKVDAALVLYQDAAKLGPDYSDPTFPIGETVAIQTQRKPEGDYLSCPWIEGCLHLHHDRLAFCCNTHERGKDWPIIGPHSGGPVPVDFVLARREQLRRENQAGEDNGCLGCPDLERGAWKRSGAPFDLLILNTHTVCNQKCDFCFLAAADFAIPSYFYMAGPVIGNLIDKGWLAHGSYVLWGGGEPTLSKEFADVATRLLSVGCHINIYSNATIVQPILLEALRGGQCDFVTSMDSGTAGTFHRVKYLSETPIMIQGRPAFDVVWDNISTYADACSDQVLVKYIFTPNNSSDADVAGFIENCKARGIGGIIVLTEVCDCLNGTVSEVIWSAMARMVGLAHAQGIRVLFHQGMLKVGNIPSPLLERLMATEHEGPGSPESDQSGDRPLKKYMDLMKISASLPRAADCGSGAKTATTGGKEAI